MKYGCIGERLGHSFSKTVHNLLADYEYELKEISKDNLKNFMTSHQFQAINVTIPYKEQIIPYLHSIDEHARAIGSVNTVVNRDGLLYGYNTDFYGMSMLIRHADVSVKGEKVAVLGTGGTSKTAKAVAESLGAKEIVVVSRKRGNGVIDYEELYKKHSDINIIINTTPLGMYPDIFSKAVDLTKFPKLKGVIDAVYNPLRTSLVKDAINIGVPSEGGLYMLVAQAVKASEIFLGKEYNTGVLDKVYQKIKSDKENIVLIGMPASGKSTVGRIVADKLNREFVDTDLLIERKTGLSISQIFENSGEDAFRRIEAETVREISGQTGLVIATGGGLPLNKDNMSALSLNGKIYFIDRPLELLCPTDDRPLTSTREAMAKKFLERYDIYKSSADVLIKADCDKERVADAIIGDFNNENICN